jgi:hypothetical protein
VAWPVISKQVGFLGAGGVKNAILQIYAKNSRPGQAVSKAAPPQGAESFQEASSHKASSCKAASHKAASYKVALQKLPHTKQAQKKAALRAAADN